MKILSINNYSPSQINKQIIPIVLLLFCFNMALCQSETDTTIHRKRFNTVIIGSAATYSITMVSLNELWYKDFDRSSFHFFNDSKEWKQVDKFGHIYSTYQFSHILSKVFQWTNLSEKKSDWIGTLVGFGVVSSVEIFDGFSTEYGASASDLAANAIGSGLYISQKLLWKEVRFHPKYSFHRTEYPAYNPSLLGKNVFEEIVKDYNGQTYWLSIDMDKFVRFPKWLNLAIGYGAEEMIYANDESNIQNGFIPYRQFYLSLDFDLTSISSKSKVVNTLIFLANMIKIPGPTIEFSQGKVRGYIMYF